MTKTICRDLKRQARILLDGKYSRSYVCVFFAGAVRHQHRLPYADDGDPVRALLFLRRDLHVRADAGAAAGYHYCIRRRS